MVPPARSWRRERVYPLPRSGDEPWEGEPTQADRLPRYRFGARLDNLSRRRQSVPEESCRARVVPAGSQAVPPTHRRRGGADMKRCALGSILLLVTAALAAAQQGTSEMRGRAVDQQEAALPGVAIVVTNQDNGTFRETVSGADGAFLLSGMTPGTYEVRAEMAGFKKYQSRGTCASRSAARPWWRSGSRSARSRSRSRSPARRRWSTPAPRRSAATSPRRSSSTCRRSTATSPAISACCPASCRRCRRRRSAPTRSASPARTSATSTTRWTGRTTTTPSTAATAAPRRACRSRRCRSSSC